MAAQRVNLVSLLLGLISSLIACVQVNFAMLTVHLNYVKERANIFKLLSLSDGRIGRQRQLKRLGRQPRPRRFWVRPGRTSAWWDNFVGEIEQQFNFIIGPNKGISSFLVGFLRILLRFRHFKVDF